MNMTYLSRNKTLRTTAILVLAALLSTVVTNNNVLPVVEAHQCVVGKTCQYGTSCFAKGLGQLLCDSPSYSVTGTLVERSSNTPDTTSPTTVPEASPTTQPSFRRPRPQQATTTAETVTTKAATVTTINLTAAPRSSPPTNVPTTVPTFPPFTSPWTEAPTDKCWPGNVCDYNTSCLIGRIQLLCNAPHWDVTGSFVLRNNNPNYTPVTTSPTPAITPSPSPPPTTNLPSVPPTTVPTKSSIVVTAAPTAVPPTNAPTTVPPTNATAAAATPTAVPTNSIVGTVAPTASPSTNAPTVPPTNATAAAATPTAVPTNSIVGTAAPTTSPPPTNATNAITVPPTNTTNGTTVPPTNATPTAVPTKRIVVTVAPVTSPPPTNAPTTLPSTTTTEVPPSPSPTATATEAQTKRIVATPAPTATSNTDHLCITNGVGATCPSGAGLPEIACCSSGITGAFFNACCPSQFVGISMGTVTVTGGDGATTELQAFEMVMRNGVGIAEPADCVVSANRQGCSEFAVPGNEVGIPLTLPSGVEGPCVEMVGSEALCSTTQGTCTAAGRTFPVCCPTCATGTYLPGQSCAVTLPDPAACGYNINGPGRGPGRGPSSVQGLMPPPEQPMNTASIECSAYAACRATNLQGNCCPTDEGLFLACCDGIDPIPTTPDAIPVPIVDSDAAPEEPVLAQTLVSVSDPVFVPEFEPEPIVPESVMDPTNVPTTSANPVISESVVDPTTNISTVSTPTPTPTLSPPVSTISPTGTEVSPITAADPPTQVQTETNIRGAVISKALSSGTTADSSATTTKMVSVSASFHLILLGSAAAIAGGF